MALIERNSSTDKLIGAAIIKRLLFGMHAVDNLSEQYKALSKSKFISDYLKSNAI